MFLYYNLGIKSFPHWQLLRKKNDTYNKSPEITKRKRNKLSIWINNKSWKIGRRVVHSISIPIGIRKVPLKYIK